MPLNLPSPPPMEWCPIHQRRFKNRRWESYLIPEKIRPTVNFTLVIVECDECRNQAEKKKP